MKFKKITSIILALTLIVSLPVYANAAINDSNTSNATVTSATKSALYVHGVTNNTDESEAWQMWQYNSNENCYYFYLPTGADKSTLEIYNNSESVAVVNGVNISAKESANISYSTDKDFAVTFENNSCNLKFMKSSAEAAVYVNNTNADGQGTGLWEYLSADKSNSASATGAIVSADGSVDNTSIKKIKGRGNTTWDKDKKPFNITYSDAVGVGTLDKTKKFSLLANYQDASLSRNRFLYDLSDAVGMPYASDSSYVDFYVDGVYEGSYQMCQKIDTGKGSILSDIDDKQYLNDDGSMAENFNFVCEVDAGAVEGEDYFITSASGNKITVKVPELEAGDALYNSVLNYVKTKFDAMFTAIKNKVSNLDDYVDVDSLTKIYLINELGKNWDAGVSSLYFTFKQDAKGNWKFFASPVWDYDNSLGNATGVSGELRTMGVTDYEEPTGWWCKFKGGKSGGKSSTNIMFNIARNTTVTKNAPQIWFEEFLPCIERFTNGGYSTSRFLTNQEYFNLVNGSAQMNYTSGWLLNTGDWICDHSSLNLCHYDKATNTYTQDTVAAKYDTSTFKGEYDYAVDWMLSRSAWLSAQMYSGYTPSLQLGDVNSDGVVSIFDATQLQQYLAQTVELSNPELSVADVNGDTMINVMDVSQIQMNIAG